MKYIVGISKRPISYKEVFVVVYTII
jgi:hypothetical protein